MTVHFVGAGPGAADLLTVRGVNLLRASPVCLYAGTYIDEDVLAYCAEGTRLVDTQKLDINQITEHLLRAHHEGLDVVRLCSGDPSIYSALAEQTRRLDEVGVPWDVTPGVPAFAAAAALLRTELTVPELVQTVVLTRTQARSTRMPETEALSELAKSRSSLVLHLAITRIRVLVEDLVPEYGADCPVAVVAFASRPNEVVLRGTLADIAEQVEAADLRHTAVVLVGRALEARGPSSSHLYDPGRVR
jgi:precorrin-4/cobalt-precorrin-4 C11-methyltransferase